MAIYIIKDESGNEIDRIVAEEDYVSKKYDFYELFTKDTQKRQEARMWRDSELTRTDTLALLPDYPQAEALLVYRQALRNWTDSEDFPDVRPEMAVEVVQPEAPTEE